MRVTFAAIRSKAKCQWCTGVTAAADHIEFTFTEPSQFTAELTERADGITPATWQHRNKWHRTKHQAWNWQNKSQRSSYEGLPCGCALTCSWWVLHTFLLVNLVGFAPRPIQHSEKRQRLSGSRNLGRSQCWESGPSKHTYDVSFLNDVKNVTQIFLHTVHSTQHNPPPCKHRNSLYYAEFRQHKDFLTESMRMCDPSALGALVKMMSTKYRPPALRHMANSRTAALKTQYTRWPYISGGCKNSQMITEIENVWQTIVDQLIVEVWPVLETATVYQ